MLSLPFQMLKSSFCANSINVCVVFFFKEIITLMVLSDVACGHVFASQGEKGDVGEPGTDGQNGIPVG